MDLGTAETNYTGALHDVLYALLYSMLCFHSKSIIVGTKYAAAYEFPRILIARVGEFSLASQRRVDDEEASVSVVVVREVRLSLGRRLHLYANMGVYARVDWCLEYHRYKGVVKCKASLSVYTHLTSRKSLVGLATIGNHRQVFCSDHPANQQTPVAFAGLWIATAIH